MKRAIVLSCFTGNGILLIMILLFFGISAVPMPSAIPTLSGENVTTSASESALGLSTVQSSTIASASENPVSAHATKDAGPQSARIEMDKNLTKVDGILQETRQAKSLHDQHNKPDLVAKNESASSTETSARKTSTQFSAKQAIDDEHELRHLNEGDAPPKVDVHSENKFEGKPQEFEKPRLILATTPRPSERDLMIQRIFGGKCTAAHWDRCSRIENWGGDYLVPDKNNPGEFVVKTHKIRCAESPKSTMCLKNGWTVARCHMLCMSQCNVEYRMNYEKLVLHEGDCRFPLLK